MKPNAPSAPNQPSFVTAGKSAPTLPADGAIFVAVSAKSSPLMAAMVRLGMLARVMP
jgi:hypothetical protein